MRCFMILVLYGFLGHQVQLCSCASSCRIHSTGFLNPGKADIQYYAPKARLARCRMSSGDDDIPPYNLDPRIIEAQVLHYGPEIPGELWQRPCRPPGFVGYKGMSAEFRYCRPDRAIMSRMMRRRYKHVLYKHVRAKYKEYIRNARNNGELIYWQAKLDSLPRDSSLTRYNRICMLTGRTRAVSRLVGLTRHQFRKFAYKGLIPGIKRANW
ncbi:Ribosomal protein S14p/S29e family protein [Babesia bovis T2Bo]|uniref:Ribosomal protein S14p/S29e family protein n=1 Tax=Babesia bovis T2Bo TaxID=484906 RepID=UPI001C358C23|nr:Ribosomal protein S14p/S29e family protein [Babesia bovis T2Bo]EDO05164.2 Ribosomal protein S14p/S29e family protein [Babesia bovis T2Bo]